MLSSHELLFFFSALGAFNGFLLSLYFAVNAKKKIFANYFLSLLLLVLSIRIIKSVFFYFNPHLSNTFIQIGLSACILIGPFLFLYLRSYSPYSKSVWITHTIPYLRPKKYSPLRGWPRSGFCIVADSCGSRAALRRWSAAYVVPYRSAGSGAGTAWPWPRRS